MWDILELKLARKKPEDQNGGKRAILVPYSSSNLEAKKWPQFDIAVLVPQMLWEPIYVISVRRFQMMKIWLA